MQILETEKGATHARIWRGQNTQVEITQSITYNVVAGGKKGLTNLAIYLCVMLWKISKSGVRTST